MALPVVRLAHRATLEGTEHLPATGGFLLVANHPSSIGSSEFAALAALYAKQFGRSRPLAGFALAGTFGWWPLSWVFAQLGVIPSTYAAAKATLAAGVSIVLFPGGDYEGLVPIVPMGFGGMCAPLLFRSRFLAYFFVWPRLAGVKRYGLSVLAVLVAAMILRSSRSRGPGACSSPGRSRGHRWRWWRGSRRAFESASENRSRRRPCSASATRADPTTHCEARCRWSKRP
jgi:hypothetical protein